MLCNSVLFPSPQSSYSSTSHLGELIYIPVPPCEETLAQKRDGPLSDMEKHQLPKRRSIPCLYLPYSSGSSKIILFFHANAEDIGNSYDLLSFIRDGLKINILAIEYPGYGISIGQASSEALVKDAFTVYRYLTGEMGVRQNQIVLMGRSIGTGLAC